MSELPIEMPPEEPIEGDERVVGILLAAGRSTRFGDANKLLAEVREDHVVTRAASTLCAVDLPAVVAILSFESERIRTALPDSVATDEHNSDEEAGLSASVATGIRAARDRDADAAVFALGDMPWVSPGSVEALTAAYRDEAGTALAVACNGKRGNPVLFDESHFDALLALEGDVGGRAVLLEADEATLIETSDPGVRRDIDHLGDTREE